MKKRFLLTIFVTCVLCAACCGCSTSLGKYADKISELRTGVYEGSNELYYATAVTGLRENPFLIDGKPGKTIEFLVVTVRPKNFNPIAEYSFSVTVDGREYRGALNKHPFEESYSADIAAKTDAASLTITVTSGTASELVLSSVVKEEYIQAEKAFQLALNKLKGSIENLPEYEIYVRLIRNPASEEDKGYYWYVAFVGAEETYAVLIDPVTTEIVACRD